jgi:hypothetical protein
MEVAQHLDPSDPIGLTYDEVHRLGEGLGAGFRLAEAQKGRLTFCGHRVVVIPTNWKRRTA